MKRFSPCNLSYFKSSITYDATSITLWIISVHSRSNRHGFNDSCHWLISQLSHRNFPKISHFKTIKIFLKLGRGMSPPETHSRWRWRHTLLTLLVAGSLYIRCLDCEPVFDLLGGDWEFNPSPWLRITPTLVTANFGRGGMGRGGRKEAVGKGTTPAHCFFFTNRTRNTALNLLLWEFLAMPLVTGVCL